MESEDSEEEDGDKHNYTSETPPIDFDSEDDLDEDYEDDANEIPCFRVVVTRKSTLVTDSVSYDTTDSDVEPQLS